MLQILFALFPLAAYLGIFLYFKNCYPSADVRLAILRAAVAWTLYLVLILELLSLFKAITQPALVIAWLLPCLAAAGWMLGKRSRGELLALPRFQIPTGWDVRILALITLAVLAITLVVAWTTPPQTWDTLSYHYSRIAHWAQNRSIAIYASGIERQNSMTPGAELIGLNYYVLTHGDRLANFPQWISMLGSLIGVSFIAMRLGARPYAQWLAVVFAATFPIGISESTSTITDYVAAFWAVCAAAEALAFLENKEQPCLLFATAAAGLGCITKPTILPYLACTALGLGWVMLKSKGWIFSLRWGAIALAGILLINSGYLTRNLITFGSPLNPVDVTTQGNAIHTVPALVSNVLKHVGQNIGLPYARAWNETADGLIRNIHERIGIDVQDTRLVAEGRFQVSPPSTNEDIATNPFHTLLVLAAFPLAGILLALKKLRPLPLIYACLVTLAFLLYCFVYRWHIFSPRYEVVFYALSAPVVGIVLGIIERVKIGVLVAAGLAITSFPWLFKIDSRPLIPTAFNPDVQSILTTPRERLYFGVSASAYPVINQITTHIQERGCSKVGLMMGGDDPEYLFWVFLGAPRRDLQIEWIVSGTPSAKYEVPDYRPCAIICDTCSEEQRQIRGLDLYQEIQGYKLYLDPVK
ncbi:MAG TPA: hypothetical protein VMT46_02980 [Anaerolineaceae bacterium]|nr:hypothetical protein [Anaerolineaceae bacterium]